MGKSENILNFEQNDSREIPATANGSIKILLHKVTGETFKGSNS